VQRQEEDCRALAAQLGWDVTRVHVDNDLSAYSGRRRPDFEAMLDAMKNGELDALICWHTDRLFRHMKDLERLIEIAEVARVRIRTVHGGDLDLSTSAGKMVARILGSVARQESEHMSERRVRFNIQKAEQGKWQTAHRPFGYTMTGEPLEPEATAFRTAVTDVLGGKSIRRVAVDWNAAGLKTTRGTAWSAPRVRRLLMSPRYAALKVHRGKVVGSGDWTPLIDETTHRGLVAFLSDPSRRSRTSFERRFIGAGVYLCGECGAPMRTAYPNSGKRVYVCSASNHVARLADPVDEYIEMVVLRILSGSDVATRLGGDDIDVDALHAKRAALQARLEELAALFAEGAIDGSQLRRGTSELRTKIAGVDSVLADLARTSPTANLLTAAGKVQEHWENCSPDLKGKIVDELMVVRIMKAPRGTKGFHPEYIDIKPKVGS
jgi:site-specific DNA recombinase